MTAKFSVIDTTKQDYEGRDGRPPRTIHYLHLLDAGPHPIRQIVRLPLPVERVGEWGGGQLNGKQITVAVRELGSSPSGPRIGGDIIEVQK